MVSAHEKLSNPHVGSDVSGVLAVLTQFLHCRSLISSSLLRQPSAEELHEIGGLVSRLVIDNGSSLFGKVVQGDGGFGGVYSVGRSSVGMQSVPTCFAIMCGRMGVNVEPHVSLMSDLDNGDLLKLREYVGCKVGYTMYGEDDPRNHVVPVETTKSATVDFKIDGGLAINNCAHGVTSAQEFFNPGGRFYRTRFYASSMTGTGFGADAAKSAANTASNYPLPPESVVGSDVESGGANVTRGVVRPRKRVIKSVTNYDRGSAKLRNYAVSGSTMFNNVDEMFLNVISREYAQEIMEHVFQVWQVPTEEPESMRYAEDLVFAFIVARTASNKADYKVSYDVPTKTGSVQADFSVLSRLLADHYGITRRNFSRAVADDIAEYLRRPENQAIKSRAAARIGADPQYGHLCFDGSTECTNMTTTEQKFTRVLEARNLYESDAVLADGASSTVMEGIHSGTRSNVAR